LSTTTVKLSAAQCAEIKKYGWGSGNDNCFTYAMEAAKAAVALVDKKAEILDKNYGIGGVWKEFPQAPKDKDQVDITVKSDVSANMVDYIQQCIDKKYPVVAGVNSGHVSSENDGVTDHFLVITGYKEDSGDITKIWALDNASSVVPEIEFSVNSSSKKIAKPVLTGSGKTNCEYIDDEIYVVTQLRVWKQVKPKTRKGVWGSW
jgi:hypothetical protein